MSSNKTLQSPRPAPSLQVVIETVDSFQGKQMDVVIMSCVRASEPGQQTGIGFVADVRRLNVAITRAKRALWILGSAATLKVLTQPAHYLYCIYHPFVCCTFDTGRLHFRKLLCLLSHIWPPVASTHLS